MPRGTKKPAKPVKSDPRFKALVGTQDQTREEWPDWHWPFGWS